MIKSLSKGWRLKFIPFFALRLYFFKIVSLNSMNGGVVIGKKVRNIYLFDYPSFYNSRKPLNNVYELIF